MRMITLQPRKPTWSTTCARAAATPSLHAEAWRLSGLGTNSGGCYFNGFYGPGVWIFNRDRWQPQTHVHLNLCMLNIGIKHFCILKTIDQTKKQKKNNKSNRHCWAIEIFKTPDGPSMLSQFFFVSPIVFKIGRILHFLDFSKKYYTQKVESICSDLIKKVSRAINGRHSFCFGIRCC